MRTSKVNRENAEILAINAVGFLAGDETRLQRFLALSGLDLAGVSENAANPEFLAAILDYILNDEPLLIAFAESQTIEPNFVERARYELPGAAMDGV